MYRTLAIGAALAALAGCTPAQIFDEAGSDLARGPATEANRANMLVQTGQRSAVLDLAARFAAEVPDTVTFAFDSAVLEPEARAILDRQAAWIRHFPEVRFRVYGHTDLVGTAAYNRRLGQRRAEAVVAHLVARGVDRGRLEALVSHGQTQPLIATDRPERRNRRTVTEVSGFVARHPTVLDGRYARVVQREYVASATRPLPSVSGTTSAF